MKWAPLFLAILIHAIMLWSPCHSFYIWKTHLRMIGKIQFLANELVMDAEMKVMAIQNYRDQYYKSLQYQLGDIVYEIRHYYKNMTQIYQIAHRDVRYGKGDYYKTIDALVEVQRLAMHIETKVKMVQGWQYRRETPAEHHIRMNEPLREGAPRDFHDMSETLSEAAVRARMQRGHGSTGLPRAATRQPPPPVPRKNKKWRHVTQNDFKI